MFNNGTLTLTNCTVSGNISLISGGLLNAGTATLNNCAVTGNGYIGLDNRGSGTLTVTNSTISGNFGGNTWAGGVSNNGTATLTNCTITGNYRRLWWGRGVQRPRLVRRPQHPHADQLHHHRQLCQHPLRDTAMAGAC